MYCANYLFVFATRPVFRLRRTPLSRDEAARGTRGRVVRNTDDVVAGDEPDAKRVILSPGLRKDLGTKPKKIFETA